MKVTQKKILGDRVLLEATASVADVDKGFEWASLAFIQQMGLAPEPDKSYAKLAEEKLGVPNLDAIVLPRVAEFLVPFAIEKKGIIPAFPPKPAAQTPLKRGQEFTFTMEVLPKPSYELESYEPVSLTVEPFEIDESEIEAQLEQMARSYCDYEAVEPRPAKQDDFVKIAVSETKQDGEPLPAFDTEGRTYPVGQGYMPESFDKEIVGMEPGQTKEVTFQAPSGEGDVTVTCKVELKEIQQQVIPELNDEWLAKNMPFFRDVRALRESIEYQLKQMHRAEYDAYVQQMAVSLLGRRFKGRIDDSIYEAMRDMQMKQLNDELQQAGMSFDQFVEQNGGRDRFNMSMMMQVRTSLVNGYALDALYAHEKLTLSDEDFLETARMINPENPQSVVDQMQSLGSGYALREMTERRKAAKWLVDHANITVKDSKKASEE